MRKQLEERYEKYLEIRSCIPLYNIPTPTLFLVYSPVYEYWGYFQFGTNTNKVAMNVSISGLFEHMVR